MNNLLHYSDFIYESRKPPLIVPQFVFHTTSADPNSIKEKGLLIKERDALKWGIQYDYKPCVFAAKHKEWLFGSTYLYVVVIDTTLCDNVWLYDDNATHSQWIKTETSIPPEAIVDIVDGLWDSPYCN